MNNTMRFIVTLAALLSVSLLTDPSAPGWLLLVPCALAVGYVVYALVRWVGGGA